MCELKNVLLTCSFKQNLFQVSIDFTNQNNLQQCAHL